MHWLISSSRPFSQQFLRYFCESNKVRFTKFLDELEQHYTFRTTNKGKEEEQREIPTEVVEQALAPVRYKLEQLDAHQVMEFLRGMNAVEPCLLDVRGKSSFDYLVVTSGRNSSHIASMARRLAKEVATISGGRRRPLVYGRERSDWIAVDMDRIVVHCMLQETRERYQIEQVWLDDTI